MVYLKWFALTIIDLILYLTLPIAVPVVAAMNKAMPHDQRPYTWGSLWGTWDNPPQGDEGFVKKRAFFPNMVDGWKGYINRCQWMFRNKLYGFAKLASIPYDPKMQLSYVGNPNISDKAKIPGYYFAKVKLDGKLKGFEFYAIWPYGFGRDVRVRLGWKMMTPKFKEYGFAQHVNTFNPLDGYGDD